MRQRNKKELINQVVNLLKAHPLVVNLCNSFEIDPEYISNIAIEFESMDISAKARADQIFLNSKFLEDGNIVDDLHYIVHELVHVLQHLTGAIQKVKKSGLKFKHYLDNPLELQAFKEQIKFIKEYKNEKEAEKYLNNLLDFHEIQGRERRVKEELLRG